VLVEVVLVEVVFAEVVFVEAAPPAPPEPSRMTLPPQPEADQATAAVRRRNEA
jgi:hypothetical protein